MHIDVVQVLNFRDVSHFALVLVGRSIDFDRFCLTYILTVDIGVIGECSSP